MRDVLEPWDEVAPGWTSWKLHDDSPMLDNRRHGVDYEDWNGHKGDGGVRVLAQDDQGMPADLRKDPHMTIWNQALNPYRWGTGNVALIARHEMRLLCPPISRISS